MRQLVSLIESYLGLNLTLVHSVHTLEDMSTAYVCDGDDRVFAPRTVRLAIGEAAPQIDDGATTYVDAARRADLAGVPFEVRTEGIGHPPPAFLDMSLH